MQLFNNLQIYRKQSVKNTILIEYEVTRFFFLFYIQLQPLHCCSTTNHP